VQGDGSIQRVAAFHPDPFKARLLKEIMRKFPIAGNTALHPIERAIGLAKPELLGVVDQVLLEKLALGRPAGYIEEVSKIGMTSIVVAPLHSQERVAGALVFLTTRESGRRLRESDLALAQELAERASAAIENARLFREAQAALAQANQAVRMRDEFLSIASHELRTPVTSMKIRAEMMIQGLDKGDAKVFAPERVERVMRESNKSLDRLTRLIEDMLDISRIQTGRLALNVESTSLASIAGEVLERFSQQLAAAGIEARLETEAQAEGNWDSSRLDQVVTNLITNALRYAPGKPLMVRVRSSGARAILEVEDQGPGIAPENQEKIFQRFERLVSANEVSGMGLGLYISREILRAHGGEIRVRSELGRGAAFVVDLPLT
jgi:signal transduction histidine kinase